MSKVMLLKFCMKVHVLCEWNSISHVCVASKSTTCWERESPFGKFAIHSWKCLWEACWWCEWCVKVSAFGNLIFFETLKFLVVNWLPKSLQPSMTFDLRRHVDIEGKGVCMHVWFKSVWLLHNYTLWGWGKLPCEAPPKHWAREDTRPHMLVWVHGIRTSPFYVYVVCVFVDLKVVKPPHPHARSPLASR